MFRNRLYFIQSVSSRQGDNAFISDYEVTIKEFRIAGSIITQVDSSKFADPTLKTQPASNGKANTIEMPTEQTREMLIEKHNNMVYQAEMNWQNNPSPQNYLKYVSEYWKRFFKTGTFTYFN